MVQKEDSGIGREATKLQPEIFKSDGLGAKIGNTLIGVFRRVIESTTEWFEERLVNFVIKVLIKIEQSGSRLLKLFIEDLEKKKVIPETFKPLLDEIKSPRHEIGALLASTAASSAIGGLFGALFDPTMASTKYNLNEALTPYYPTIEQAVYGRLIYAISKNMEEEIFQAQGYDSRFYEIFRQLYKNHIQLSELIELYNRRAIKYDDFIVKLSQLGFDEEDIDMLINLIHKIPSIVESIQAFFRGEITQGRLEEIAIHNGINKEFLDILVCANRRILEISDIRAIYYRTNKTEEWVNKKLASLGYDEETIAEIKALFPYFPSVPDLIRFAVREVYTPKIVEEYGLMEDLPPRFLEEARKAGLPEEQAKNYWASHWELPSLEMGYEMFHRGVISLDELKTLMRTQDIMPRWRDKLIQISYNPLTRVDVRRMYSTGVLSVEQVFKAYKDLGYSDENARLMTEFTVRYERDPERDLSKSEILEGYRRKFFNKEEATNLLMSLGYDETEIEYYISKEDYKEQKEYKDNIIKLTEDMFKKGLMTENDVIAELSKQGLQSSEINYYLKKWIVSTVHKTAQPEKGDLKNWLKNKIITREEFVEEMAKLGYSNKYIDYYLKELTGKGL